MGRGDLPRYTEREPAQANQANRRQGRDDGSCGARNPSGMCMANSIASPQVTASPTGRRARSVHFTVAAAAEQATEGEETAIICGCQPRLTWSRGLSGAPHSPFAFNRVRPAGRPVARLRQHGSRPAGTDHGRMGQARRAAPRWQPSPSRPAEPRRTWPPPRQGRRRSVAIAPIGCGRMVSSFVSRS